MTTLGERWATEFPKHWRHEGRQEGLAEGRREGVELLLRQAALRFGEEVGEQVRALLAETDDWDRLAEGGELIIRAESGAELLHRLVSVVRLSN